MIGENFPYVNFHDLNLDWIIKELKAEKDFLENDLEGVIEEMIRNIIVNLAISYEAESETLVFTLGEVENNG